MSENTDEEKKEEKMYFMMETEILDTGIGI